MRPFNNPRYLFDCKPDCPGRKPGCHDHCEKYQTRRKELDRQKKDERNKNLAGEYLAHRTARIQNTVAKNRRSLKGYHGYEK